MAAGSAKLSWRLDPEETFSDWTIEITPVLPNTSDHDHDHEPKTKKPRLVASNSAKTYNVHKNVLGFGNRKSQYFVTEFKGRFAESSTHISRIPLDPTAAAAFPAMLDFMYGEEEMITSENAIPLLHLADYFVIPALSEAVNRFVKNDLSSHGFPPRYTFTNHRERRTALSFSISYFHQATAYLTNAAHVETIKTMVVENLAEGYNYFDGQCLLEMPLELLKEVVASTKLKATDKKLARRLVAVLKGGAEVMDDERFRLVTNEKAMPVVPPKQSLDLLKESIERSGKPGEKSIAEEYASLQDRCIKSASAAFDILSKEIEKSSTVDTSEEDAVVQPTAYQQLPPSKKVLLLESALRVSASKVESLRVSASQVESLTEQNSADTSESESNDYALHHSPILDSDDLSISSRE